MILARFGIGIGDRFARQWRAQLQAFLKAKALNDRKFDFVGGVWNGLGIETGRK